MTIPAKSTSLPLLCFILLPRSELVAMTQMSTTSPILFSYQEEGMDYIAHTQSFFGCLLTFVSKAKIIIFSFSFLSRREHLTPEQIKEHEEIQKKVETGNLGEDDFGKGGKENGEGDEEEGEDGDEDGERETVQSLPPPPPTNVTWEEYINAPDGQ